MQNVQTDWWNVYQVQNSPLTQKTSLKYFQPSSVSQELQFLETTRNYTVLSNGVLSNAMLCNAIQCNEMLSNATLSNAMLSNVIQCDEMQRDAMQC